MTPEPRYITEIPDLPSPNLTPAQRYYRRCRKQAGYQRDYRARQKAEGMLGREKIAGIVLDAVLDGWVTDTKAYPGLFKAIIAGCVEAGVPVDSAKTQVSRLFERRWRASQAVANGTSTER